MATWRKILHTTNVLDTDLTADGSGGTTGQLLAVTSGGSALEWIAAPTTGIAEIATSAGLDGSGTSGTVTLSLNFDELTALTTGFDGSADHIVIQDNGTEKIALANNIQLSQFDNDSNWTANTGDITNVTAGDGLSGGGASGAVTLNVDFSELTDMTGGVSGTTEVILQDGTTESRKAISEINLGQFNNDQAWTANTGDLTALTVTGDNGGQSQTTGVVLISVLGGTAIDTVRANGYEITVSFDGTELTTNNMGTAGSVLPFLGGISVAENATFNGTVTMNSSTVTTTDHIIELADGSASSAAATLSGISVDTANATQLPSLLWTDVTTEAAYGNNWHFLENGDASTRHYINTFEAYNGAPPAAKETNGEGNFIWDYTNNDMYVCVDDTLDGGT